ncbi:MAG: chitobiase/beta-hexosaminidase C-terminal domain-containing protein, partial [Candidatus Cloacimonetes bacterium]|nr:chitobiase/beta-hexosaminidase C-terminal domain-containing protein [Candidatus Cloacimonadota bacterium]
TVDTGNTDWAAQQGTNAEDSEWIVMPQDNIDDLGTHTYNPGAQYAEMPVFDPPAGTYFSSVSVTITSTTAGAAIRYTTDGTDPTATTGTLYSGPVSISSTTTLKAIAYAGGYEPSLVNTADYTITSSTQVADIATLRAQTTGSNVYTLTGEAILTFQQSSRNQKYIQDATGAILIDDNAGNITTTYNLYDGITGISGTLTLYSNLLQFVPVADPGEATSSNNVVEPEVRTLASLGAADQAKLIKVMNVTITGAATFPSNAANLTATDPTASLTLRTFPNADYAGTAIPTDPVNLTCLVGQFNDTMQIGHRFLSDIEEIGGQLASPVVDLSIMDNMLHLDWNAVSGASSYRVEAADDPYAATFSVLGTTTDPGMLITPSSAKKFYRVIALP